MPDEHTNRDAFRYQYRFTTEMDAPITGRMCLALAEGLNRDSRTGRRALDWRGHPIDDALPLRLVGGLHALAQQRLALEAVFAGEVTNLDAIIAEVQAALIAHDALVYPWLDGPPQTNEPARSSALVTGLLHVIRRFDQPLEVLEIGSSAGLNLMIDRYGFDLGGTVFGPENASLKLRPDWRGRAPQQYDVRFASVRGCDVNPLDLRDPAVARRLRSYIWADNPERQTRMDVAIAMLKADAVQLDAGDAADWLEARLAEPQAAGTTRVLMHSVVWQYLPDDTQRRVVAAMHAAGAAASEDIPLAWVSMEPERSLHRHDVAVRMWPGEGARCVVAGTQAHGAWIEPLAAI